MADRISSKGVTPDDDFGGDALDLIEITGVIKWFDVAKGFGFIVPDNGMQDVLLHVTCLRRDGYQTVLEGARVVALIQKRDRGYQAFRILSMDQSTAVHPSQLPPVQDACAGDADERAGAGARSSGSTAPRASAS